MHTNPADRPLPVAYVRTVKTASGATAVQIVHSTRRGARDIEHLGSAHDEAELEALKAAARQRLAQDQLELDPQWPKADFDVKAEKIRLAAAL